MGWRHRDWDSDDSDDDSDYYNNYSDEDDEYEYSYHHRPRITNHFDNQVTDVEARERKGRMVEELTKLGLTLRTDSRLCHGFIQGDGDIIDKWTADGIAEEMAKMKYYFDYCSLASYIHSNSFEDAKSIVASRNPIPEIWPWLKIKPNIPPMPKPPPTVKSPTVKPSTTTTTTTSSPSPLFSSSLGQHQQIDPSSPLYTTILTVEAQVQRAFASRVKGAPSSDSLKGLPPLQFNNPTTMLTPLKTSTKSTTMSSPSQLGLSTSSTPDTQVKRGRGRPKKQPVVQHQPTVQQQPMVPLQLQPTTTNENNNHQQQQQNGDEDDESMSNQLIIDTTNIFSTPNDQLTNSQLVVPSTTTITIANNSQTPAKRGRGRPKKSLGSPLSSSQSTPSTFLSSSNNNLNLSSSTNSVATTTTVNNNPPTTNGHHKSEDTFMEDSESTNDTINTILQLNGNGNCNGQSLTSSSTLSSSPFSTLKNTLTNNTNNNNSSDVKRGRGRPRKVVTPY